MGLVVNAAATDISKNQYLQSTYKPIHLTVITSKAYDGSEEEEKKM